MDLLDWLSTGLDLHWWNYVLAGLTAVAFVVVAIRAPRFVTKVGNEFARQHHAYVSPSFAEEFDRTTIHGMRRWCWLAGIPFSFFVLVGLEEGSVLRALAPGLVGLGLGIESVLQLRRAGDEFRIPRAASGVARGRAVGIRDFLPPGAAVCSIGLALSMAAFVAGLGVAVARRGPESVLVASVVSSVTIGILMILLPIYWHVMANRPEPSQDAAHLYLQDAWRAHLLSGTTTAAHAPVLLLALTLQDTKGFPFALGGLAALGLVVSFGCRIYLDDSRNLHFRKRLWPTLHPDQVLQPGDVMPSGSLA